MRLNRSLAVLALTLLPGLAFAQSSASYRISDQTFNNGGDPRGPVPSSGSYQISLDSIGDPFGPVFMGSGPYRLQGSFVQAYRPPGEVLGLDFANLTMLTWQAEPSVGDYAVYRSEVQELALGDTGICLASQVSEALVYEPFNPDLNHGWFYLVTARNRLEEEGTKGYRSNGTERPNPGPCP